MHRRPAALLAGLTLLGALLRFATLDLQSYELDEVVTARLLDGSLDHLLHQIPKRESTPPLYYLLAWGWTRPFGTGEVGLRSLSALVGTITVPVAYLAARQLLPERGALAAAALVAVNPLLVWEGQEARAYAQLALLGMASFALFARSLGPRAGGGTMVAWGAVSAAALATHYFAAFLVVPEAAWLLMRVGRRAWPAVAGVAVAIAALLPLVLEQRSHGGADVLLEDSGSLGLRLRQLPKQWLVGFDAPLEEPLAVAAVIACAVALWLGWRSERRALTLAAAFTAVALALPFVLAVGGVDYLNARNCLAVLPVAAVAVAAGAGRREGLAGVAGLAVLGVAVCLAVALEPRYQRDDWRGAADALGRARVARLVVVRPPELEALAYYLPGSRPSAPVATPEVVDLELPLRRAGEPRADPSVRRSLRGYRLVGVTQAETFAFARFRREPGTRGVTTGPALYIPAP